MIFRGERLVILRAIRTGTYRFFIVYMEVSVEVSAELETPATCRVCRNRLSDSNEFCDWRQTRGPTEMRLMPNRPWKVAMLNKLYHEKYSYKHLSEVDLLKTETPSEVANKLRANFCAIWDSDAGNF